MATPSLRLGRFGRPVTHLVVLALVSGPLSVAVAPPAGAVALLCADSAHLAAGGAHTLSLDSSGALSAWGDNSFGQLGDGTQTNRRFPVKVENLTGVAAMAGGFEHSLALTFDGAIWAWGHNGFGQLGDGTTLDRAMPVLVPGLREVVAVAAGGYHSIALRSDGTVWAWGRNVYGQLGNGTTTDSAVPVQVSGLSGVTAVASGGHHSLALRSDGTARAWGLNSDGQVGDGSWTNRSTPRTVSGLSAVTALAAGAYHSLALRSDGTMRSWGHGYYGQLGDGQASTSRNTPVTVLNLSDAVAISGGGFFSLAILSNGTLWSWGSSAYGELGDGSYGGFSAVPGQVSNVSGVKATAGGGNHAIAMTSNGRIWTWGGNWDGQVGDGTATDRTKPVQLASPVQASPGTPVSLEAVPGEQLAYLQWEPAGAVTQYVVTPYVGSSPQTSVATGSPRAAYAVRNLNEGTTYAFTVSAQNCLGESSPTSRSNRVVPTGVQLGTTGFKIEGHRLTDRMNLNVNAFNGNLNLFASDLRIRGTGLNLVVDRSYHNRGSGTSSFGNRWSSTVGSDVKLSFLSDGAVLLHAPGGAQMGFAKEDDGTYSSPSGLGADLSKRADGSYTLTFRGSGDRLEFSAQGAFLSQTDRNGNTISYAYDATGRLTEITDTQARVTSLAYNAAGLVETITDPSGRVFSHAYDASKNLTAYTDPAGGVTAYAYDGLGNLTRLTTPAGRRIEMTYDASRRVLSVSWPLQAGSPTTTFTYGTEQTVVTDPRGKETTYAFDPAGRTTLVIDALRRATATDYTSNANVRRYQVPTGGATTFSYDGAHNLVSVSAPAGASDSFDYDDPNHPYLPTKATDPQGNARAFLYDTAGNLVRQTHDPPWGAQVNLLYNPDGTLASSTDAKGSATVYSHDAQGNITGAAPPLPLGPVSMSYDALSRIVSVTDGKGQETAYTYDLLDRVTEVVDADGRSFTYSYDADGNLTQLTDPTGTTTNTYDGQGRLTARAAPGGKTTTYTYDASGNLTALEDGALVAAYAYDDVNLPGQATFSAAGSVVAQFTFTHDASYRRASIGLPGGVTRYFRYDDSGRTSGMSAVDASGVTLYDVSYDFSKAGEDTAQRQRSSEVQDLTAIYGAWRHACGTYTYDILNRLVEAKRWKGWSWWRDDAFCDRPLDDHAFGLTIDEHHYTYDSASNRTSVRRTQTLPAGDNNGLSLPRTQMTAYHHNAANQLTGASNAVGFLYDANGNLTSSTPPDLGGDTNGDGIPDPLADKNGNGWPDLGHDTDGDGLPDLLHDRDSDGVPDVASDPATLLGSSAFAYNASDQTVAAATPHASATFTYRGRGQRERIATGAGEQPTTFTHTLLGLTSQTEGPLTAYFLRDPDGGLLGWRTPQETYAHLTDTLGSVVGLTDSTGRVVARYDYDPYGALAELWTARQVSTDVFVPLVPLESLTEGDDAVARANPYRFASAYLDPTGLLKMGERYYDPTLGRFTQQDPIYDPIDPLAWNRYVYVGGNPINFIDPTGLSWWSDRWEEAECVASVLANPARAAWIAGGAMLRGAVAGGLSEGIKGMWANPPTWAKYAGRGVFLYAAVVWVLASEEIGRKNGWKTFGDCF